MKKNVIAFTLIVCFLTVFAGCGKSAAVFAGNNLGSSAKDAFIEEHSADDPSPDTKEEYPLDGVNLASYDADVILGKRRCLKNGYRYKQDDFAHVFNYDNLPTLKIERYFDYDKDGEFVEKIVKIYEGALNCLPESVQKMINDTGVTVHCVLDIKAYWRGSNPPDMAGLYDPVTNNLYIACGSYVMLKRFEDSTLYHELGHAVDNANGRFSDTDAFLEAFYEERDNDWLSNTGGENHSQRSVPAEAFAGLFQTFLFTYANPSLQNSAVRTNSIEKEIPKLYAFMTETVGLPVDW